MTNAIENKELIEDMFSTDTEINSKLSDFSIKINKGYVRDISNRLKLAELCSKANTTARTIEELEKFISSLSFGKKVFDKFVRIGNATWLQTANKEDLASVSDYNILEMLAQKEVCDDVEKQNAIISLAQKNEITRDKVKEIISGSDDDDDNDDEGLETDKTDYDTGVCSVKINTESFRSEEDIMQFIHALNSLGGAKQKVKVDFNKTWEKKVNNHVKMVQKIMNYKDAA